MNFRDVELLSSYLDGQTSPSDSTRLEARLKTDPELGRALQALRESRGLLRQLPHRRAPRNFTLTRQMVGLKPPLPRAYPVFRFATALATILFIFSFASNQVGQLAAPAPASISSYAAGGAPEEPLAQAAATEAPAAGPSIESALMSTATPELAADANRVASEEPVAPKMGGETSPAVERSVNSSDWLTILGLLALLGAAGMFAMRRAAANKWREK